MVSWSTTVNGGGSQPWGSTRSEVVLLLFLNLIHNKICVVVVALSVSTVVLLHKFMSGKPQQKKNKYKIFPGWAALEIAIVGHLIVTTHRSGGGGGGLGRLICSALQRGLLRGRGRGRHGDGGSLYGLTSTHQILVNHPDVDRLLSLPHHTLSAEPIQYTLFTRVFGATDTPELKTKLERSWKSLLGPVERMFLNDTSVTAALEKSDICQKVNGFVSFSSTPSRMKPWELSADVGVPRREPRKMSGPHRGRESRSTPVEVVEVNLLNLCRDFGACVAIPILYNQNFLDRHPGLLKDFWKFDNDLFPLLMMGVPGWVLFPFSKAVREGLAARSRLLDGIEGLYRCIDKYQQRQKQGQDDTSSVDLSGSDCLLSDDVSRVALERNSVYRTQDWSFRERAAGDLAILWGQNANTHAVLFWFLLYICSTPGLCDVIRRETEPYIVFAFSDNDREEDEPKMTVESVDIAALCRDCPVLKACLLETLRVTNEATSIRYVKRPFTVWDGLDEDRLNEGTFVSVPHSIIQRDPSTCKDPDRFDPDRFLEDMVQERQDRGGSKKVVMTGQGVLRPWSLGASMCKGRTFAEKEIMVVGAAIVGLWDIEPAATGPSTWEIPDMLPGTGVKKPARDVRVAISRRKTGKTTTTDEMGQEIKLKTSST